MKWVFHKKKWVLAGLRKKVLEIEKVGGAYRRTGMKQGKRENGKKG